MENEVLAPVEPIIGLGLFGIGHLTDDDAPQSDSDSSTGIPDGEGSDAD
jgi:hypothetical protein